LSSLALALSQALQKEYKAYSKAQRAEMSKQIRESSIDRTRSRTGQQDQIKREDDKSTA
jgi:hypothetical protein